ncbi:MAG: hypothetical protein H6767_03940 [Candidatus Peribacteria bacterium]|nr:MAG: hypothetical protein H6767_03940 [Candidatus Peribacteria bacterium]
MIDTPQNNFAVWNSLRPYQYSDFSHGNLQIGNTSSSADEFFLSTIQTIGASGKYYTEHTIVSLDTVTELSRPEFIVYNSDNNLVSASYANYYGTADGRIYKNGSWV